MTPFNIRGGRIVRLKPTSNGPVEVPLSNFTAIVKEELLLDNGVERSRVFVIEGCLSTGERLPAVCVPANRFASMNWVTEQWGVRAVVLAGHGTRDYLREAIQSLSPRVPQRRVFVHTGWREIGGSWAYLTSSGAVGREDVEVDLDAGLERYCLPCEPEDPVTAMQESLRLLNVAPLSVTVPLWAGVFRAPLAQAAPIDFTLWLEGKTGSLKSTIAALFLSHYGFFDYLHLPGSWISTANQLERRAFALKDAPFVVDDYAPRTGLDNRDLEAKAARLLRAQGNLSGRGRLRQDLTEQTAMPPRGLIISTGEQHPPGQSVMARTFLVELKRSEVRVGLLTMAQRNAGRLQHAMSGYIRWLAPQVPELHQLVGQRLIKIREHVQLTIGHLRIPQTIASFWLGFEYGLSYAQAIGACSAAEADRLGDRAWKALLAVGGAQNRLVAEERPTLRFLRVLATLVTQGPVFLLTRLDGTGPAKDRSDFIGWHDDAWLYLMPDATFTAVTKFTRDSGEPLPIREERVRRELAEEQLLEHDADRLTKNVRIAGDIHRVLCLPHAKLEDALGEPFPVVPTVTGHGD